MGKLPANALILTLKREYKTKGTNGKLLHGDELICNTIELPWEENQPRISCIPEGVYQLRKRSSPKFGNHLELLDVPSRFFILIHPANNAIQELNGCIAPVTTITGEGLGVQSRTAVAKVYKIVTDAMAEKKKVFISIEKN